MIINCQNLKNKDVVFSDELLPLSEFDDDTKLSTVIFMEEFEIQNCVDKLFEKYPSLFIDTLLYSKETRRLYIYANQEVETLFTEYRDYSEYTEVHSKKTIFDALNLILEDTKKYSKPDHYNLIEVSEALRSVYLKFEDEKHQINKSLDYEINRCMGRRYYAVIYNFKYENDNTIEIVVTTSSKNNEYSFIFQKSGNTIFLKRSNYYDSKKLTSNIYDEIEQLFNLKEKYKDYLTSYGWRKLVNSNAVVFLSLCSVCLEVQAEMTSSNLFEISYSFYSGDYSTRSVSMSAAKIYENKEKLLFKKAYISTDSLPDYLIYELEHMPKGIKKFLKYLL